VDGGRRVRQQTDFCRIETSSVLRLPAGANSSTAAPRAANNHRNSARPSDPQLRGRTMEPGHPCLSSCISISRSEVERYLFAAIVLFAGVFGITSCPAFAQTPIISTVAGGSNPSAPPAQNACLPIRAATFLQGNAYVMSCNRVFKVDTQGNWTLVAGNCQFELPEFKDAKISG
jgi:hypothetical protein